MSRRSDRYLSECKADLHQYPAGEYTKVVVNGVDHPPHYQGNKYEAINIIEDYNLNFSLGNAIKYILRAGKKGDKKEDLHKAIWYLERESLNS